MRRRWAGDGDRDGDRVVMFEALDVTRASGDRGDRPSGRVESGEAWSPRRRQRALASKLVSRRLTIGTPRSLTPIAIALDDRRRSWGGDPRHTRASSSSSFRVGRSIERCVQPSAQVDAAASRSIAVGRHRDARTTTTRVEPETRLVVVRLLARRPFWRRDARMLRSTRSLAS